MRLVFTEWAGPGYGGIGWDGGYCDEMSMVKMCRNGDVYQHKE